jgi:hypothetical protein
LSNSFCQSSAVNISDKVKTVGFTAFRLDTLKRHQSGDKQRVVVHTANKGFAARLADGSKLVLFVRYQHWFRQTLHCSASYVTFIFKKLFIICSGQTVINASPAASPER